MGLIGSRNTNQNNTRRVRDRAEGARWRKIQAQGSVKPPRTTRRTSFSSRPIIRVIGLIGVGLTLAQVTH
jgi:hypothetical protein